MIFRTKKTLAPQPEASSGVETVDADAALMLSVKHGDDAAFSVLFDKHKRRIVNFARRYLGSETKAEDAAQEVFLRLYRARADYQPVTKFSTYLYRIATNTCLNHLRKRDWLLKDDGEESPTERLVDTHPRYPSKPSVPPSCKSTS